MGRNISSSRQVNSNRSATLAILDGGTSGERSDRPKSSYIRVQRIPYGPSGSSEVLSKDRFNGAFSSEDVRVPSAVIRMISIFRTLSGAFVALVALAVLVGWTTGNLALVRYNISSEPMLPLAAIAMFMLGVAHLLAWSAPGTSQIIAITLSLVIVTEGLSRAGQLPTNFSHYYEALFRPAGMANRISLNELIALFSLCLAQIMASYLSNSARAQATVIALSFISIGIGSVAIFGYTMNFDGAFSSVNLAPNSAVLLLVLGLSKAVSAWVRMLPLTHDFAAIISELRFLVLTFFLFVVSVASSIALLTVYETQTKSRADLLHVFTLSARQSLETYFERLGLISGNFETEWMQHKLTLTPPITDVTYAIPRITNLLDRLGIKQIVVVSGSPISPPVPVSPDESHNTNPNFSLDIEDDKLFFVRASPHFDTVKMELDLTNIKKVVSGLNTGLFKSSEIELKIPGYTRNLLSKINDTNLEISDYDSFINQAASSNKNKSFQGQSRIVLYEERLANPDLILQVAQGNPVVGLWSKNSFIGMLGALAVLAIIGAAVLMHLVTQFGARSTRLGTELNTAVQRLEVEMEAREKTSMQIRKADKEKEVLLKEVHHRVKNNLQIISSIFNLQARSTKNSEIRSLLQEATNRIQAISVLHQTLYRSDNFAEVQMGSYVNEIVSNVLGTLETDKRVRVVINSDGRPLEMEKAIPLGLILTEFLTNSLKYAWPSNQEKQSHTGVVVIDLSYVNDETFQVQYSDDGIGMPPDFHFKKSRSLGSKLVQILTEQLHGELYIGNESKNGAVFKLTFPLKMEETKYASG